jgi:threonylcarbamoyladenosine tRNA methylthiotransferase CDKAL1
MKIFFRDLNSCAMRKADVERYRLAFKTKGYEIVSDESEAEVICIWTCAFRQDFRDNSFRVIERANKSGKKTIVVGCLPDIDPRTFKEKYDGIYVRWRFQDKEFKEKFDIDLDKVPRPFVEKALSGSLEEYAAGNPEIKTMHCDQFVKVFISEGCPLNCTYCAEILAFPEYKSFSIEEIIKKTKWVVGKYGEKRIVLHGDCVGAYGEDIGCSFNDLLDRFVNEIPGIQIGIRNIHPMHFLKHYDEILEKVEDKHIFLIEVPIQSANDRILKLMDRKYNKKDIERIFFGLSDVGFKELETHIIAGFPSETEDEFNESIELICKFKPKYVLVSGFMKTDGMPAAQMTGQIDFEVKKNRVIRAYEEIINKGIICNYDMCDLSKNRFEKKLINELVL